MLSNPCLALVFLLLRKQFLEELRRIFILI
uniref:Uncharacterized protein n=1 Tax=Lepeophtheirus salmonis TaxID=72036 RepID=A0A0K2V249_LEPSM